jgi:sugar lactone lactonase YvrE
MKRGWRVGLGVAAAVAAAVAAVGSAVGGGKPGSSFATTAWTTVLRSTLPIEGLTGDDGGNLYVAARGGAAACPVYRVEANGPANQTPVVVGSVAPPCSPSGLTFGPDGRLYLTGAGAAGDAIAVLSPNAGAPPVATIFATGTPATLQPPLAPAPQNIVANGLAFTPDGALLVADTARGALWRVELDQDGSVLSPVGCDTTFTADTLCFEDVFVQHPLLDGADGIALDRAGNVWVDANERNAIAIVDREGRVSELFRNPVGAGNLRNGGPLEFPTSPFLADRTLCTTSSDGNRRDNSPNSAGEVGPGTGFAGKISCADERLQVPGLPLPVG